MKFHRSHSLGAVSCLALYVALSAPAFAEEADVGIANAPASSESAASDDALIVVTGTRLKTSGFDAPTPVSVLTEKQIQLAAPATISDFVNQLPALAGSVSPRTNKGGIGNGQAGVNLMNLRSLGAQRTLVLLNGRRVTPTTLTAAVDVNTIPDALVKRVDVVTGGASAAWGSDAVAGVVNFVLDTKFKGLKGNVQAGVSNYGDAENLSADLSFGTAFASDRGHFIVSAKYNENKEALYRDRGWFKGYKFVANPRAGQPGQTTNLAAPWASQFATNNGIVTSGPLAGYYFANDGTLAGTNFPMTGKAGTFYIGDEAVFNSLADQAPTQQLSIPVKQYSIYGRASYELTDNIEAFIEGSYAGSDGRYQSVHYGRIGNTAVNVARDNFYLPASVATAMTNASVTTIPVSIFDSKLGRIQVYANRDSYRGQGGLQGTLGDNWKWDASFQYGQTRSITAAKSMARKANYDLATDVVANPSNPSQPICRSTIASPTNGCVPINIFGSQPISDIALAYVTGTSSQDLRYTQTVSSLNLAGDLVSLPAGPLSLATGVEYRTEKAVAHADAISQASAFYAGNFKNFSGKYNVKDVYGELGVPVFKDSALGRSLNLNLAARYTDYSVSGSVTTWKGGVRYEPINGVEFRLTRSRDIRAPNLQDLFQPGLVTNQAINDPLNGNAQVRITQTVGGSLALKPEKADALTVGLVLQPGFAPGLRASVDYYDIKIKGAIASYSGQFVVNQCSAGNTQFCQFVSRDNTNALTAIALKPFNAQLEQARGVDFELSYTKPVGNGTLDMRVLANYVDKLSIVTPTTTITRAGEVSNNTGAAEGVPHWRGVATVTYDDDRFTTQLKGRLIGSAQFDDAWGPTFIDIRRVPAIAYLDAYVGIKTNRIAQNSVFYVSVDNVLNTAPPIVVASENGNTVGSGTNPFLYDVVGRTFRAGFRFVL
ncbi:TonB-dependent receptor domain-containing protein [Aquisediminimonas sediminicola]|uniref:TonB-dependent receptor domain-containing protein n=1 Tax=Alteraquisediminimonas sediminicola TaxID=2676787 RepID=UPI001C8E9BE2|nr:TonB-dependent receptor [Aquisediminimonas sediminicola]